MFYIVTIQEFVDETPTAKAIFEYDNKDTATATLFSTMASSMANDNIASVVCLIMDEYGSTIKYERWERPTEDSEGLEAADE